MNSIDKNHLIRKIEKYNLEDLLKEQNQTSFPKVKKNISLWE
jgi:hypothetical protein